VLHYPLGRPLIRESLIRGDLPRSPRAPVGAFGPALNGSGCASPLSGWANAMEDLCQYGRHSNPANKAAVPLPRASATEPCPRRFRNEESQMTALSIEFVAKPHEAHRAQLAIPSALAGALKEVTGFAGCLVMVFRAEARLLTVVTLWSAVERRICSENLRWVRALLRPIWTAAFGCKSSTRTCLRWLQFLRRMSLTILPSRIAPVR